MISGRTRTAEQRAAGAETREDTGMGTVAAAETEETAGTERRAVAEMEEVAAEETEEAAVAEIAEAAALCEFQDSFRILCRTRLHTVNDLVSVFLLMLFLVKHDGQMVFPGIFQTCESKIVGKADRLAIW